MSEPINNRVQPPEYYTQFPKEHIVLFSRWEGIKARLFGLKIDEPMITAYLYKGKWYITRLGKGI